MLQEKARLNSTPPTKTSSFLKSTTDSTSLTLPKSVEVQLAQAMVRKLADLLEVKLGLLLHRKNKWSKPIIEEKCSD